MWRCASAGRPTQPDAGNRTAVDKPAAQLLDRPSRQLVVRASLWFVPSLIVLASMGAAVLMTETDGRVGLELATHWPRLFGASADASRAILLAITPSLRTTPPWHLGCPGPGQRCGPTRTAT